MGYHATTANPDEHMFLIVPETFSRLYPLFFPSVRCTWYRDTSRGPRLDLSFSVLPYQLLLVLKKMAACL